MDDAGLLRYELYGGTLLQWGIAVGVTALVTFAVAAAKPVLLRRYGEASKRSHTSIDDAVLQALKRTQLWAVMLIAASAGAQALDLPARPARLVDAVGTIALFLQAGMWASALLQFWVKRAHDRAAAANPGAATSLGAMGFVGRVLLWAVIVLLALDNLGFNITALVAGLGIGGVAVALAVQNILGDLFASLSIVLDKPFVVGDFIIVDTYMGSVEYIGLKTTRIRSLSGEQIVFSNSDLLNGRIRNYKRMLERRIVFKFGVLYDTKPELIEKIPPIVKRIVESKEHVRFDRAHFFSFGESSLDFEVVFWVTNPDYNLYMDIQQAMNLELMRELAVLGVEFAYPTRTLHVASPVRVETTVRELRDGDPGKKAEPRAESH